MIDLVDTTLTKQLEPWFFLFKIKLNTLVSLYPLLFEEINSFA